MDLFELADKNKDGVISAVEFGAVVGAMYQSTQNTVRDVYSLIDIEKNGWFS
jgi:Ca2+-binding EF-hand superfamily protein